MPILKPDVTALLAASGIGKKSETLKDKLEEAGLGLTETFQSLSDLRSNTQNENTIIRVNETILKLHGVMNEQQSQIPAITIVINDTMGNGTSIGNPILLPRELHKLNTAGQIQQE
jgi:hypothetical protein